jgi:hypothetical protein
VKHRRILSGELKRLSLIESVFPDLAPREKVVMAHSTLGTGSRHAEHFHKTGKDAEVATLESFQKILDSEELDLKDFTEEMAYLGFDKTKIAKLASIRLGGFLTVKFVYLGAMRGTNLDKILKKSVKPDKDIKAAYDDKRVKSNGTGTEDLTVGRLLAVFPEIASHYMNKHSVPKKLPGDSCPAALQFPAAAALPMNANVRLLHLEFAVKFSFLISKDKKFHPKYYRAAFTGQLPVKRLSPEVLKLVGNPTDAESSGFDLENSFGAMMVKYGKDRFEDDS